MDKELYTAESNTTAAQAGWKSRKQEFPKDRKLKEAANKIVRELDVADEAIEKARKLDHIADEIYDKDKARLRG